ncbi:hypothetical protein QUA56_34150 [Microcoleus sp. N3A4]|uniref:hypothetical protein n=1 Tax=Microcoleus sp. N3A4 TaxID=3055379 RepID=UPI002FD0331F
MNNRYQTPGLSFDVLKLKYKVIKLRNNLTGILTSILKRRDAGTSLTSMEMTMLTKQGFSEIETHDYPSSNPLYQILTKVESGGELNQVDIDWLTKERLFETIAFIRTEQEQKTQIKNQLDILKKQYKISTYLDYNCDILLLQILKNIQNLRTLSDSEVNWLKTKNLVQPLEIYQKQELQKLARQQEIEERKKATEFSQLKLKYKATKHEDSSLSSPLYPILIKMDRGKQLIASEIEWLKNNRLFYSLEIYQKRESERIAREQEAEKKRKAEKHFYELKVKYRVNSWDSSIPNRLYLILCKIDKGELPINSDITWLKSQDFSNLTAHVEKMQHLTELKIKYKAAQHQDTSPSSHLYKILKQLETSKRLNTQDGEWLKKQQLLETFAIFQEREAVHRDELSQFKDKYKASKHQDSSGSNKLYKILQKLESKQKLIQVDIDWLKKHGLTDTIAIAEELQEQKHFVALKSKYQATQYEDLSLSSPLYQILKKLDSGKQPSNAEVNWLSKHSLNQVIEIAKERESQKHFTSLRAKYNVSDYKDKSPYSNLYLILQKLDRQERLEATDVAWLTENELLYPNEKITIEYHKIEAIFYEQEFYRTKNGWNLPSASSHWRKADESQTALKLTDNLDWDMVKDKKLKSALLTTRGGAYRDIQQLNKAEKCAKGAIEYQPESHHPYTLMGAICYERGQYLEGDSWFNEAIKRGANPRDMDSEIKRVVRNAKNENKRREVVEYLLKKDPSRYAWAKAYLKKPQNQSL